MTVTPFQQANQLLREGRLEQAIAAYRSAVSQNPDFYLAHHNLGEALENLGLWEEAVEAYRQAVQLKPKAAWSLWGLSRALQQVGRFEEAQQISEQAVAIDPRLVESSSKVVGIAKRDSEQPPLSLNTSASHSTEAQKNLKRFETDSKKITLDQNRTEVIESAKAFKSTELSSDLGPLIIFSYDEPVDLITRKLFLSQNYAAETGLHIVAVSSSQREAISRDKSCCNSLLVLARCSKEIADQKINFRGGYWKTLRVNSESVLLSIFLEPGQFMTREYFADILRHFQSLGSSDELKVQLPSLKLLIPELLAHQGDAYIKSVEDALDKIINHVSSSVTVQRKSIVDLLNVLMFSLNSDAIQAKLHSYLNKTVAELQTPIDDSRKEILSRRLDSCIYLAFELSGKNSTNILANIFKPAIELMVARRIPARMLSRGLRHSFLKAIELSQLLPILLDLAEITHTDDSITFLAIQCIICNKSVNTKPNLDKTWRLLKKIFIIPKPSLISLVRALRRTVPCCLSISDSLSQDIISWFEIAEKEIQDRETSLARCLLLLYADCFDVKLLNWITTHYQRIGLTSEDKDILLALTGYDIPLIARVNEILIREGFKYKVLCPSQYYTIIDYMKANLAEWKKYSQASDHSYTSMGNREPLISVIITTFNPDLTLLRLSLESIINQTYPALEIILIDDHSSPESSQLIDSLMNEIRHKTPHLIVYQRNEKNVGQYVSRNRAIALSKGEFIAIQDDDDISHPTRLQHQLQPMLADSSVMATHAYHLRISENSRLMVDGDELGVVVGDAPVSFIWRKQVFQEIGNFLATKTRGDVEFRLRMRRHYSEQAVQVIAQPLVLMRGGMGTVSSNKEYYFRSALNAWRYMMNYVPIGIDGSQETVRWIPTLLK